MNSLGFHKDKIETSFLDLPEASKSKLGMKLFFYLEKLLLFPFLVKKNDLFKFSFSKFGIDISKNEKVQKADIIHLHWVNNGFLSISTLEKLIHLNKPIVWTLHDMWPITGGCTHSRGCMEFEVKCSGCHYLHSSKQSENHLASKYRIFHHKNINFVACSTWLYELAKKSIVTNAEKCFVIPNPLDPIYAIEQNEAGKSLELGSINILFISANIFDHRKGFKYLYEAVNVLNNEGFSIKIHAIGNRKGVGKNTEFKNVNFLGYINDKERLKKEYLKAHIFSLPSLEENLPNVIMESLACGTPVLSFDIGGIKDLILNSEFGELVQDVSQEMFTNHLKKMILKINNYDRKFISESTLVKFSEKKIADQYLKVYNSII